MKNYEFKIYVDLDGVLADFSGRIKEITGHPAEGMSQGKMWSAVQRYDKEVAPFFETLNKMPDADLLWGFVTDNFHSIRILTATGWTPRNARDQKIAWAGKMFGVPEHAVKVVSSGTLKAGYASPQSILVDDTRKALDPWEKAGGIGVFHTSAADSIKQLQEILKASQ